MGDTENSNLNKWMEIKSVCHRIQEFFIKNSNRKLQTRRIRCDMAFTDYFTCHTFSKGSHFTTDFIWLLRCCSQINQIQNLAGEKKRAAVREILLWNIFNSINCSMIHQFDNGHLTWALDTSISSFLLSPLSDLCEKISTNNRQ